MTYRYRPATKFRDKEVLSSSSYQTYGAAWVRCKELINTSGSIWYVKDTAGATNS